MQRKSKEPGKTGELHDYPSNHHFHALFQIIQDPYHAVEQFWSRSGLTIWVQSGGEVIMSKLFT